MHAAEVADGGAACRPAGPAVGHGRVVRQRGRRL